MKIVFGDARDGFSLYFFDEAGNLLLPSRMKDIPRAELIKQFSKEYTKLKEENERIFAKNPWAGKASANIKKEFEADEAAAREKYPEVFYYYDGLLDVAISQSMHPAGIVASPITLRDNYGTFISDGKEKFEGTSMETCDDYDLWGCIQKDFTTNAKKIVQVFMDHIRPMCKKLSLSDVQIAEADKDGRLVALPSDKALTNADRMRAATNQQLAKLLYDNQKEFCRLMYKNLGFEDELTFSEDYSDILAWLNAPAEMGVVQDKDE